MSLKASLERGVLSLGKDVLRKLQVEADKGRSLLLLAGEAAALLFYLNRKEERLKTGIAALRAELKWCSGSPDFCEGGQARKGWLNGPAKALEATEDLP